MESMTKQQGGPPQGAKTRRNGSEKILGANSAIATMLDQYFKDMEKAPVPDDILQLVAKLESVEREQGKQAEKEE